MTGQTQPGQTAQSILAVRPDLGALVSGALVPSRGTHRRLQALIAIGWSQAKLAARLGLLPANFGRMMHRSHVTVALHRAVATLFDELWATLPPRETHRDRIAYTRTIKLARARRWLPPLAWDDIDNDVEPPAPDDEKVDIDETAVELALAGEKVRLSIAERRECVRLLHAKRWSDSRVAETIGCADRTVQRIREELGLAAWEQNTLLDRGAA